MTKPSEKQSYSLERLAHHYHRLWDAIYRAQSSDLVEIHIREIRNHLADLEKSLCPATH